jgi:hypothetical protein
MTAGRKKRVKKGSGLEEGGSKPKRRVRRGGADDGEAGGSKPKRRVRRGGADDGEAGGSKPKRRVRRGGAGDSKTGGSNTIKKPNTDNPWLLKVYHYRVKHPNVAYKQALINSSSKKK